MSSVNFIHLIFGLSMSPLLFGVINRTKAVFAGRMGQPLLQSYYDLWKLFHKGMVYSVITTWVFRVMPMIGLAVIVLVFCFLPSGGSGSLFSFPGDFIAIAYLLGLARMFLVLAALDTGSSFEGMGASREVQFSFFSEIGFLVGIMTLSWKTGKLDSSSIFSAITATTWMNDAEILILIAAALFIVLLVECSRVPFDDPNTHLELTMIHEVMVLDHSGPDFGMILYGSMLKMWIYGTFLVRLVLPFQTGSVFLDLLLFIAGMLFLAISIGITESLMARFRLLNIPRLLIGVGALSFLALILSLMG